MRIELCFKEDTEWRETLLQKKEWRKTEWNCCCRKETKKLQLTSRSVTDIEFFFIFFIFNNGKRIGI
jgi:hypothetical protein